MGIHLCRSQALVAEKFLHDTKVGTAVEKVRCKRVAKCMRVKSLRETCGTGDVIKSCACTTLTE